MRKISQEVAIAFLEGRKKKSGNTMTDGKSLYLHGNEIAKIVGSVLYITTAGWDTPTTKERLNALPHVSVRTKNGRLELNGKPWNGGWIEVYDMGNSRRKISGTGSNKIQSIDVIAKRWFQKSYGNTYHRVRVFVNGQEIGTSKITYGYGDHYVQTAMALLKEQGFIKDADEMTPLWSYCRKKGIDCNIQYKDVKTERELKNF